jgi:hypothetical protein
MTGILLYQKIWLSFSSLVLFFAITPLAFKKREWSACGAGRLRHCDALMVIKSAVIGKMIFHLDVVRMISFGDFIIPAKFLFPAEKYFFILLAVTLLRH